MLDYRCDADYIVGAFQQAYGIDLTADKVHWWRFKALLHALPPETPLGVPFEPETDTRGEDDGADDAHGFGEILVDESDDQRQHRCQQQADGDQQQGVQSS